VSARAPNPAPAAIDITVVVPVLNDADSLRYLLPALAKLGWPVVVSDGGSTDNSASVALDAGAHLVVGTANRGEQLARGAAAAESNWILFLHSDCQFSEDNAQQLLKVVRLREPAWGRFDVSLQPATPGLRCISWFMNQRSRLTKICTGDQGIFLHRHLVDLIDSVGGMPCQPLMEDIELSKRLQSTSAPFVCLASPLNSSARRWHRHGVVRTVLSMWRYRLRYWLGASPQTLAQAYYEGSSTREADRS
jgi:rSAM/selenodomain-associated transferase 2